MKQIVQDLRTFSRMDQADLQMAQLTDEIDRTLALMEPRFKGGIEIERDYQPIPEIRCFPGQLNQVFLNLLMNACDVLEEGGTITIRTRADRRRRRLRFEDTGPGSRRKWQIPHLRSLLHDQGGRQGDGLGSLALPRHHRAPRRDASRSISAPGKGAIFEIDLPLEAPEIAEEGSPDSAGPGTLRV